MIYFLIWTFLNLVYRLKTDENRVPYCVCVDCLIYRRVLKLEHSFQQQQHSSSSSSSTTTKQRSNIIIINNNTHHSFIHHHQQRSNERKKNRILWGFYFYIDSQIYLKFRIWEIISRKDEIQDLSKISSTNIRLFDNSTIRRREDWDIQPGLSVWIYLGI